MNKKIPIIYGVVLLLVAYTVWQIAPSEKTIYKEPPKQKGLCDEDNETFEIGKRVLIKDGYYGGIEGEITGHSNDAWCGQAVRLEFRGTWYSTVVKSNNLVAVSYE